MVCLGLDCLLAVILFSKKEKPCFGCSVCVFVWTPAAFIVYLVGWLGWGRRVRSFLDWLYCLVIVWLFVGVMVEMMFGNYVSRLGGPLSCC